MNNTTAQIINVQLRNNNVQLQRSQNFGGLQNGNAQYQGALNIGRQPLRPQNLFNSTSIAVQYYAALVEGTEFFETQGIENPPPQRTQSLTPMISG
ncbi:14455_t:CDS:1, partial [Racocetra persica]